jgi:5-methylcytosine-specific restriction endonuclease McrA
MANATCSVPVCTRSARCRGWCAAHYTRWKTTGDPGSTPIEFRHPRNSGAICAVVECERSRSDREWCEMHYKRWQTHGDPLVNKRRVAKPCGVEGCDRPTRIRGLCTTHRERANRNGDPLAHIPIGAKAPPKPCATDGCDEFARVRGYCRNHYTAVRLEEIKADPERLAAYKAYHASQHKKYVAANRDHVRALYRLWQLANPRKRRAGDARRYARIKTAPTIPFTLDQFHARMAYFGDRCWMCGGPFEAVDHVKPISKGGAHALMNTRPACKSCNSRKKDKWPYPTRSHLPTPALP